MSPTVLDLAQNFIVLDPAHNATPVALTPTLYEDLDRDFANFEGHTLVSCHSFEQDWPSWELHPGGEEVVMLLQGAATMALETADGEQTIELREPGSYLIIPRNTWHTARVNTPTRMLFITPGQDTRNRPA